jgi:type II secretion system protein I
VSEPGAERGFTLIEVIVALAILSVAVVASIQGFAQGLRLLKLAGDHQRATLYADQRLREVLVPQEGREEEEDRDAGFTWERITVPVETPELLADPSRESRWRIWQIAVRVRWGERRHVEVATLRTVATESDAATVVEGATPGTGPPGVRPGPAAPPRSRGSVPSFPSPRSPMGPRAPGRAP